GSPPETSGSGKKPPNYGPAIGLRFALNAAHNFNPSPAALATLLYIGAGTRRISGQMPLTVTDAHGLQVVFARRYRSHKQAQAFQYMLDRLQAWNLIAWGRGGDTLAVVAGRDAEKVLPPPDQILADARRR